MFLCGKGSMNFVSMMVPTSEEPVTRICWFYPPTQDAIVTTRMTWTIFRFGNPHIHRKNLPRLHPETRNLPTKNLAVCFPRCRKLPNSNSWKCTHPLLDSLSGRWVTGGWYHQAFLGRLQWKNLMVKGFNIFCLFKVTFYYGKSPWNHLMLFRVFPASFASKSKGHVFWDSGVLKLPFFFYDSLKVPQKSLGNKMVFFNMITIPETNSSPLRVGPPEKGEIPIGRVDRVS